MANYNVVKSGSQVWLIRNDRLARLDGLNLEYNEILDELPSNPINQVFRVVNLKGIPSSWGASFNSLSSKLKVVHDLNDRKYVMSTNQIEALDLDIYRILGEDPSITFDISYLGMSGKDAGLISFDFSCEKGTGPKPQIEFYWSSDTIPPNESTVSRFDGADGRLLLPIDATPSWLLSKKIRSIRFDIANKDSCKKITIKNINFMQRDMLFK